MSKKMLRLPVSAWGLIVVALWLGGCGGAAPNPRTLPNGEYLASCDDSADRCAALAGGQCGDLLAITVDYKESTRTEKVSWSLTRPVYHGELRFKCSGAEARRISKSKKQARYRVRCVKALGNCYERAETVCAAGYEVIGKEAHRDFDSYSSESAGAFKIGDAVFAHRTSSGSSRERYGGELIVECR